ncbi:putative ankyrin repeat protein RF_0381 [Halyomorpha halys]|uniref:putative ankyrin repeat protein RF_0381 n=1 Tax=Halyomorpha halys TaxID=286706 RepID=UPI0006D50B1F|nr:uncharacterized protein LOC106682513 [Halyomorpha halys]
MMNFYVSMREEMERETHTTRNCVQHINQRIRYILPVIILILALLIGTLLFVNMSSSDCGHKTLLSSQCPRVSNSMLQPGINFGAAAYTYRLTTANTIELTSTQALLLSLVNCLVTGDMNTYSILAECSQNIHQLKSRHLSLWLKEDFRFTKKDMQVAMAQLDKLVTNGSLKMPSHALTIISSLAEEYGITLQSKESRDYLVQKQEKPIADNTGCKIMCIATEGGNVNGSTQSGGSLVNFAVNNGTSSVEEHKFLKADLEVSNVDEHTPLEEAIKNNSAPSIKGLILVGANVEKRLSGGNSYLHLAAGAGKNGALQALLEAGLDPNTKNHFGETPLVLAVRTGNVQGTEILLQRVANASLETEMRNCLSMAVASSDVDMLQVLLKYKTLKDLRFENDDTFAHLIVRSSNATEMFKSLKGQSVALNIRNKDGLAPLHIATNPSVVKMLLDLGAGVNFTTEKGKTALHIASADGTLEVVKVLVERGVGINIQDEEGNTALMTAAKYSVSNILEIYLLNNGADLTLKSKIGRTALHYASEGGCIECALTLLKNGARLDEKDIDKYTSLHLAAREGHIGIVTVLLGLGADLSAKNKWGETPLILASYGGNLNILKLLIDRGASVSDNVNNGDTALHEAVRGGYIGIVEELLDRGADIRAKNKWGETPLMDASYGGYLDILKLLIDRGAPLSDEDNYGDSALQEAARGGHLGIVKELLDLGADLTAKNNGGWTLLMEASYRGHLDIIEFLIGRGVPLNDKANDGDTAIHKAARAGHVGIVNDLLDNGADLTAKNNRGYTPLMSASYEGYFDIVKLLIERGAHINDRGNDGRTVLGLICNQDIKNYVKSIRRFK